MSLSTIPETLKFLFRERVRTESEEFHLLPEYNMAKSTCIRMEKIRDKLKYLSVSDPKFWRTAAELAGCKTKALEAETKYLEARQLARQLLDPDDDPDEDDRLRWTENITGRMKAASLEKQLYQIQADRIARGGVISRDFVLLATSYLGVATEDMNLGRGQMTTRAERVKFRESLLTGYEAAMYRVEPYTCYLNFIFDPATGTYQDPCSMVAVQIVPHKLGHETITALFQRTPPLDLLSPDNGLVLPHQVAQALDYGALAIVPNIDDDEAYERPEALAEWGKNEPREYKWMVIDEKAEYFLDAPFVPGGSQPSRNDPSVEAIIFFGVSV
ncbi:hypothetical protein N0V85_007020 [Neurospora sp. IMI 360204]|nr:hypothetical protein N0V85_007020 [Neurospora sp. IMI 360204]